MAGQRVLNVVTLLGSLRKSSFNGAIARTLPELAPEHLKIGALGSIRDFPHYDADLEHEGYPGVVTAMAESVRAADGVIIVTPEYNYSVPGVLKNAIDWLSRLKPHPFVGKPVLIQSASPGVLGGARGQYHLRQVLVSLDARVLNMPEIMVGGAGAKVDADRMILADPDTRGRIGAQLEAFAACIRRGST